MSHILGIDVGGTGIKANIVDTSIGECVADKIKYATPQPSTPDHVFEVIDQLVADFDWKGKPIGCGFPSIVKNDVIYSAANIDDSWIGVDLGALFQERLGIEAHCVNDADAAGIAEMTYGKGKGQMGTVMMITLGTGIGSGLFRDGVLVPNMELGHLTHKKSIWEHYASNGAREKKDLSWRKWAKYLNEYLNYIHFIFSADLIILGGGVSKKYAQYEQYLDLKDKITPAAMQNDAGIIGAALLAGQ